MQWKFKTYVSPTGRAEVQDEIDALEVEVSIGFQVRIRYLATTPKNDWKKPHARKLQGVKDVYEIRFKANGVEFRPLGYFGPNEGEFTILIWAYKKQDIYDPANAIKSADKRRKQIVEGKGECTDLQIDGVNFPPIEE
ncbi:type II toxin-antitoxin system RelE/ParE family toxin [Massilia alkalitolerans]|uniref:type II toxin-antitoxin system RelE/ParE family toxin n=1 Tax=Massilia alkalitolerans TaxID=286638 RepID=UPI0028AC8259|nr:type II toxin-antitoxin system RelE/ParE family toxin [Massilia alkalitolerans]